MAYILTQDTYRETERSKELWIMKTIFNNFNYISSYKANIFNESVCAALIWFMFIGLLKKVGWVFFLVYSFIGLTDVWHIHRFKNIYIQGESKKVWLAAPGEKLYLFSETLLYLCFFKKFFFGGVVAQKNPRTLFSL